jgi:pyruvate dehydrogenase E2 component (dihydrolipoamide acetyltransferase)
MGEFRMPSLGADMEAGTLVEWLKRPGDRVRRGDVVAVVETQKGAIEVDIFEDGVIERWLVEPGATVPVGTPLALIGGGGPTITATAPEVPPMVAAPASTMPPPTLRPKSKTRGTASARVARRPPLGD